MASSSVALTLEETRQLNIARNNDFLKSLFGPNDPELSKQSVATQSKATDSLVITDEIVRSRYLQQLKLKDEIKASFPGRENESEQIFGYLDDELQASPALQMYGPSGSGKTALCRQFLNKLDLPHSFMHCAGFTNARQFYTAIWAQLNEEIKYYRGKFQAKYNVTIHLGSHMIVKNPHKFSDLSLSLGKLVYNLFENAPLPHNAENKCYYLILDGVENLNVLEAKLAINMLQLSRHSHPRIKVIALSQHLVATPHPSLVVHFPAYSEKQLAAIVFRLYQAQLAEFRKKFSSDELLESIVQCYVPVGSISGVVHIGADSSEMATMRDTLLSPLLESIMASVSAIFHSVMQTAMSGLMYTTTHPVVLLRATLSSYTAMYGHSPEGTVTSSVTAYLERTLALAEEAQQTRQYMSPVAGKRTSLRSPSNTNTTANSASSTASHPTATTTTTTALANLPTFTLDKNTLAAITAHYLPGATAAQVRAAVRLVNHLPVFAFSAVEIIQHAKYKKVELPKPPLVFPTYGSGATSSSGRSGNIYGGGGSGIRGMLVTARAPVSQLERINSESMRVKLWAQGCPVRMRYLILSAFLAGSNPKESDNLKFVGAKEGRRKKQRLGTDHDIDIATTAGSKKSAAAMLLASRYFSLERLISIYAQVVGIITHGPAVNYGDVALYASLRSLVEKGLLARAPHWDLQRPVYLSCVTYDTASELAKSVQFNLSDFMYYSSHHNTI